jgi:trimethylguanosine synthase
MVLVNISSLCSVIAITDEAQHEGSMQNDGSVTEVLEMNQEVVTTKKKKRVRRSQSCKIILES